MNTRSLGLVLLLISISIAALMVANIKITRFTRNDDYVKSEDNEPMMDRVVKVPAFNSSEGWVGFNVTLSYSKDKVNFQAYGNILPDDLDPNPSMVMRVVNVTGAWQLKYEGFDEWVWDTTKVYAAAYLDSKRLYDNFRFLEVDNSSKYCFFFRGLKNETISRPILINLKEAWDQPTTTSLLELTPLTITFTALIAVIGLGLIIRNPKQRMKRRLNKP